MVITYNGLEFFKVQSGNLTLVFNPVSKSSKSALPAPRFRTDIALVSLNHPDFNGTLSLSAAPGKETLIIDTAGEYEVDEVFIKGFGLSSSYGGKNSVNTIYKVIMEGITMSFLGPLKDGDLPDDVFGEVEGSEILFVPIGGLETLDSSRAYKLAVKLSPNVIIPMHYGESSGNGTLLKFLKEEGVKGLRPEEKLSIKKNALLTKDGEIIVLKSPDA